jgi:hypothetical protein
MLALGGLGMTLGWWADLDFGSAAALFRAAPGATAAGAWCGLAPLGTARRRRGTRQMPRDPEVGPARRDMLRGFRPWRTR